MLKLKSIKFKILIPVFLLWITAIAALSVMIITMQVRKHNDLNQWVSATMEENCKINNHELIALNENLNTQMTQMAESVALRVGEQTRSALQKETESISGDWERNLVSQGTATAQLLAQIAPSSIVTNNYAQLQTLAKSVKKQSGVLFVMFQNRKGDTLSRRYDRKNPRIKAYIKQGSGKKSVDKILDSAKKDPGILIIDQTMTLSNEVIGKIILGLDRSANQEKLAQISNQFDRMIENNNKEIQVVIGTQARVVQNDLKRVVGAIQKKGTKAKEMVSAGLEIKSNFMRRVLRNLILMIGALSTLAVMAILYVYISRIVTGPIESTVKLIHIIAQGDLSKDVPRELLARTDEIGIMAKAQQTMLENLRELIGSLAKGVGTMMNSSKELTFVSSRTADGVQDMSDTIQNVASFANQASSNTQAVATGMDQTTNSLTSVASETEQMGATANEISLNSEKARAISEQAMTQTQSVTTDMHELGDAAKKINIVTETITEISSQTNLLALNATIEAARAGESGKGFAVVADEIKGLAQKTAKATDNIKNQIVEIQSSTGGAIGEMDKISQVILEVHALVNGIATNIEEQSVVTRTVAGEISDASGEVNEANISIGKTATVSQKIAEDVDGVSRTVEEIRSGNSQVQTSAGELSALAGQLNEMVKKFQLES